MTKVGLAKVGFDLFFSVYEEEFGGARPDRLAGVWPQVWVLQRTDVEPRVVEQLVDVLFPFDLQFPEQCIEVPKVIIEDIPSRRLCREPQLAEQLAEVPTILHFLKETVDIPVPRRGGRRLQGLLPEQDSTALAVEEIVDTPVPLEGLQGFRSGQGFASSSSSHSSAGVLDDEDEQFEGSLRTFPRRTNGARVSPHSGSELGADFTSSTPSAQLEGSFIDEDGGVWMKLPSGRWTLLGSDEEVYSG